MAQVQRTGWITKEGGRYKTWKRRWMALEGDVLAYYKKEGRKEKCGDIPLRLVSEVGPVKYKDKKHCFALVTAERTYHVCADDDNEMNLWVQAINRQRQYMNSQTAGVNKTGSGAQLPPLPNPGVSSQSSSSGPNSTSSVTNTSSLQPNGTPQQNGLAKEEPKKPARLEDFELLKVIGKGSFGKVLLVRKKGTNNFYAMKVLTKKTIILRHEVEHTLSEKNILMKLQHPFLVKLHYAFQTPERLFFVMDFVNGGELFFHLQKEKRFSEDRVRFYAAEIVSGLEYLHRAGVIYRDLKPENLLLTKQGHIVMTDFGLSKEGLHAKDARTATFCGTPEYLAPEILEGGGYGKAVDWWSFGTLVYEMLTGLPPFYCEDVQQMYTKIMTAELQFPDYLSEEAKDLLSKLLERDPNKRLREPMEIKSHPFFASIDWHKLVTLQLEPPFKPEVKDDLDLANIDTVFTSEPVTLDDDDDEDPNVSLPDQHFANFTYARTPTKK
jgi:tRNA A-37 threonylcarbamoyl transferase component Bud32